VRPGAGDVRLWGEDLVQMGESIGVSCERPY
jgi:hypothetical protein